MAVNRWAHEPSLAADRTKDVREASGMRVVDGRQPTTYTSRRRHADGTEHVRDASGMRAVDG
jgi:hypothetical protein